MLVRAVRDDERDWAAEQLRRSWGSVEVVSRGRLHDAAALPAFLFADADRRLGLVTYEIAGDECEVVTLDAFAPGLGVGSALLAAVAEEARCQGATRLWLVTTNDNLPALRFYQRNGMRLVALRAGAIDAARTLKPSIPAIGHDDIPIRDELELELGLRVTA